MIGYAVCEMHYEYDDNYYNASGGYNPPTKIFKSKEKAQAYAHESILAWFLDVDMNSHFHSIDGLLDEAGYQKLYEAGPTLQIHEEIDPIPQTFERYDSLPDHFEKYFRAYIQSMSTEQFMEFYDKHIQTSPYSVVDVILED